jgi:PEP-CTERM motif
MTVSNLLRPASVVAGLALLLTTAAINPAQAAVITYQFTGQCIDCFGGEGTAHATLVLQDYTPGDTINNDFSKFVSFTYDETDLMISYTITALDAGVYFFAELPAGSGSAPNFSVGNDAFFFDAWDYLDSETLTQENGWQTGINGGGIFDFGTNQNFTQQLTETPEPSSFLMIGGGLAGVVALRRRKK